MAFVKEMVINKFGSLMVTRGTELKKQFCPYRKYVVQNTGKTESAFCECACALFGEPYEENGKVTIRLCQNSFACDAVNFKDERV